MEAEKFRMKLLTTVNDNINILQTHNKDWTVKGFIDIYKNIYTISVDTKVVSKIMELMLFPIIHKFAVDNDLKIELAEYQNHYPDITFICKDGTKYALDIKSTYRTSDTTVNGFTLGAFTGYFRNRQSNKNILYPYEQYSKHFVLGIIYTKQDGAIDEREIYTLEDIEDILSVVTNIEFLLQEKYKIANTRPGSGNTKNIGGITNIKKLKEGEGPFSKLEIDIFDDYWMYYMTKDMMEEGKPPYKNLKEYIEYKKKSPNLSVEDVEEEDLIVEDEE
ncbi:EcoRV family type II restriction endonuclease [Tissierella pigra]|uniref:Restriction endonuclease n=1 Tax=Tissierella pigra TaxID=2607614 RepID=A0A6N7XYI9_9FIRM|nr:type II restriction endonuclease [Tissierella pigra]MBU5425868.1 EcoRV family type II restriction endonuclease [Tissierella pigra]MSU01555.1 restriction endonuclease [Tissierella pigra]